MRRQMRFRSFRKFTYLDVTYLDVEGKTVTADAMHCQRETCRLIVRGKGNYVFGLKENQPSLLEDVQVFLEHAEEKDPDSFQTVKKRGTD